MPGRFILRESADAGDAASDNPQVRARRGVHGDPVSGGRCENGHRSASPRGVGRERGGGPRQVRRYVRALLDDSASTAGVLMRDAAPRVDVGIRCGLQRRARCSDPLVGRKPADVGRSTEPHRHLWFSRDSGQRSAFVASSAHSRMSLTAWSGDDVAVAISALTRCALTAKAGLSRTCRSAWRTAAASTAAVRPRPTTARSTTVALKNWSAPCGRMTCGRAWRVRPVWCRSRRG